MKEVKEATRFESLLGEYGPAIRRLCSAYRRDPRDRQDLFQEIAVALWKALPNFRNESSERTWLYRVAHNIAITDSIRRQRKRELEVPFEETPPPATSGGDPRRSDLLDAVQRLAPVERELALLYLEGLTAREIADVLGIGEGNAAVRLTRLRQQLTRILNPNEVKA